MSLRELLQMLDKSNLSSQHLTSFINGLHDIYCNGIDSLMTLFESIDKFGMHSDAIRLESVVGLHMRQLHLSFVKLSFSHFTKIYQRFKKYYEQCYPNAVMGDIPLKVISNLS